MPGSLQNKMHQFEVTPPPGTWNKIASRLDEEFAVSDGVLANTLDSASVAPPTGTWNKINDELNGDVQVQESPGKVVPLIVKIAVAAAIIGVLLIGGIYFLNSNKPENNIVKTIPENNTQPEVIAPPQQQTAPDTGNSTLMAGNEPVSPKLKKETNSSASRSRDVVNVVPREVDDAPIAPDYGTKPEQAPLYDLQTVSALQPVSVNAPPLRDNNGNIIMDASLITRPDDEYIAVTGPNGKQTKISCKFLNCLSYINAGS